ncbi:MAG: FAD-dependent oxidoreductase [Pseudomonadota bacterium]
MLNQSGHILGFILIIALLLAFIGGFIFKGRSGWCGTFCPLAPLQKAYGHAPILLVRNGYCETCLGCQKNCYDFNPRAAFFTDLEDNDPDWSEQRRFFIALLPGLIFAFFDIEYSSQMVVTDYLRTMLGGPLISLGIFYLLHNLLHINFFRLASIYAMTALVIFYWHGVQLLNIGLQQLAGWSFTDTDIFWIRYCVVAIALIVFIRSLIFEKRFRQSKTNTTKASVGKGVDALKSALAQADQEASVLELNSNTKLPVPAGQTLLDSLEANDMPIMSGCRMGMCGSDPVVVVSGHENLEPPDENELNTLRRLGLEGKARLACCCRLKADIEIDLDADPTQYTAFTEETADSGSIDPDKPTVIIIGNGIAGLSTAENLRESSDDWNIILISNEPYHFYNRMGLESVLYGRTAMQGLYLLKEEWYQINKVETWLNTQVTSVDPDNRQITLGTGEKVDYDKLVLATGASAFRPPDPCYQLPGVFTLRNAKDALRIRHWVQKFEGKRAIVLGGGVLGVEAAEALLQMGMKVTIVHTADLLMNRQLDLHAAVILKTFLSNKGIRVVTGAGIKSIQESGDLKEVELTDGRMLITDIVLLCIGVRANNALARNANLEVNRGVIVNERMQTSNPDIYCVGDAAEIPGAISGLWSVGSEQGKIAASAILDKPESYQTQAMPPVQLKVSGIDLKSFGSFDDDPEIQSITDGEVAKHTWRHLRIKNGQLVAGAFVNSPLGAVAAISASKKPDQPLSEQEIADILHKDE